MLEMFLSLWLAGFAILAQPMGDRPHLVLKWQTHDQTNLTSFYVYRKEPGGWVNIVENLPAKPRMRYTRRDYVPCGRAYTYLLRAAGTSVGHIFYEDRRINRVYLPCPEGK